MDNQDKRLYKSQNNRVISGVCGGIGEYLGIDPTVLRIVMVVLIFFKGVGLLIYFIAWLCMPKRRQNEYYYRDYQPGQQGGPQNNM